MRSNKPRRIFTHLFQHHRKATLGLIGALVALTFFSWRCIDDTLHVSRPPEPDLASWMSPRYVAKSWDLPKADIFRIMEIPMDAVHSEIPRTLAEVMDRIGLTLQELQRRVEIADEADHRHKGHPGRDRLDP